MENDDDANSVVGMDHGGRAVVAVRSQPRVVLLDRVEVSFQVFRSSHSVPLETTDSRDKIVPTALFSHS